MDLLSIVQFALKLNLSDPFVVPLPIFSQPERKIPERAFKR